MSKKEDCYVLSAKINGVQKYFFSAKEYLSSCENNLINGAIINGKPFHDGEIKQFINSLNSINNNLNQASLACYRIIEDIEREEALARQRAEFTSNSDNDIGVEHSGPKRNSSNVNLMK